MKKKEKSLNVAVLSSIKALERLAKRDPEAFWNKRVVFDKAIDELDEFQEDEDIPLGESYYFNHWAEITRMAAKWKKKYIIPSKKGVRLGSFEEYQRVNATTLSPILKGLKNSGNDRTIIINIQGGSSEFYGVEVKLLKPGDKEQEEEEQE